MSKALWPHGLQHTRPPCPSPTPRAYSNSCPPCRWWTFRLKCFCFYFYLVLVKKPKEIQMDMIALCLLLGIALQQKWQKSLVHQDTVCVPCCYPSPIFNNSSFHFNVSLLEDKFYGYLDIIMFLLPPKGIK